jgi:uncharacterized protein YecE (DUF72 family)
MPARAHTGRLRVGTSGYQYRHWKGRFYPAGLAQRHWFRHYAEWFDTVEINNTFYRLPAPETFDRWRGQAPDGFVFALKFSRYGTHVKHLRDARAIVRRFLDSATRLGDRLGPILVQLPPRWHADPGRLDEFLSATDGERRWSVEFRDADWLHDEVFDVLRRHGAALCIHDMIPGHPRELTADWTYLRFHGDHYTGSYSPQYLAAEARRISTLLEHGHDVYAYFNNDDNAWAVHNALALKRYVINRGKGDGGIIY